MLVPKPHISFGALVYAPMWSSCVSLPPNAFFELTNRVLLVQVVYITQQSPPVSEMSQILFENLVMPACVKITFSSQILRVHYENKSKNEHTKEDDTIMMASCALLCPCVCCFDGEKVNYVLSTRSNLYALTYEWGVHSNFGKHTPH